MAAIRSDMTSSTGSPPPEGGPKGWSTLCQYSKPSLRALSLALNLYIAYQGGALCLWIREVLETLTTNAQGLT